MRVNPPGPKPGKLKTGGRQKGSVNKTTAEIRAACQLHGQEAINKLVSLMRKGKDQEIQLRASVEILNRGYGRSPMAVNLGGHDGGPLDFGKMSLADLDTLAGRLESAISAASASGRDSSGGQ